MRQVWEEAQTLLSAAGATVDEVDLGRDFDGIAGGDGEAVFAVRAEIGPSLIADVRMGGDLVSEPCHDMVNEMPTISVDKLVSVIDKIAMLRPKFDEIAHQYDALLTPSTPGEPGPVGGAPDRSYAALWTGLHVPTINLPGFGSQDGLPIGLSLIGPRCVIVTRNMLCS